MEYKEALTLEHMKRMLHSERSFPDVDIRLVLHPDVWEDYKKLFRLTDEYMNKYYIKSDYISVSNETGDMR